MKIDRRLNLIIPIDRDDGSRIYAHSTPIGRQVFEAHFMVIAKTFSAIVSEGLSRVAGPRIAALTLKMISERMNLWEGPTGAKIGLISEIQRLTCVFAPGANGWEMLPYSVAITQETIDEDEASEVENAIVFFSLAYRMLRKSDWEEMLHPAVKLWGGETSSLNSTEFRASLPTSTPVANTGASPAGIQSSVPI